MKRTFLLSVLLFAALVAALICVSGKAFAEENAEENAVKLPFDGSSVRINTAEGLFSFARAFNDGGEILLVNADGSEGTRKADRVNLLLTEDLTLSGEFTPLGTKERPFSGVFDGGGRELSLSLSAENAFFFGEIKDAEIRNLTFNGEFFGVNSAFIGRAENVTVTDCDINVKTFANAVQAGVFLSCTGDANIYNTKITAELSGECALSGGISVSAENLTLKNSSLSVTMPDVGNIGKVAKATGVWKVNENADTANKANESSDAANAESLASAGKVTGSATIGKDNDFANVRFGGENSERRTAGICAEAKKLTLKNVYLSGKLPPNAFLTVFSAVKIDACGLKSDVTFSETQVQNLTEASLERNANSTENLTEASPFGKANSTENADETDGGSLFGRADEAFLEEVKIRKIGRIALFAGKLTAKGCRFVLSESVLSKADYAEFYGSDVFVAGGKTVLFGEFSSVLLSGSRVEVHAESFLLCVSGGVFELSDSAFRVISDGSELSAGATESGRVNNLRIKNSDLELDGTEKLVDFAEKTQVVSGKIRIESDSDGFFVGQTQLFVENSVFSVVSGGRGAIVENAEGFSVKNSDVCIITQNGGAGIALEASGECAVTGSLINLFSDYGKICGGVIGEAKNVTLTITYSTLSGRIYGKITGGAAGSFESGRLNVISSAFALTHEGKGLPSEKHGLIAGKFSDATLEIDGKTYLININAENKNTYSINTYKTNKNTIVGGEKSGINGATSETKTGVFVTGGNVYEMMGSVNGTDKELSEANIELAFLKKGEIDLGTQIFCDGTDKTPSVLGADIVGIERKGAVTDVMLHAGLYGVTVKSNGEKVAFIVKVFEGDASQNLPNELPGVNFWDLSAETEIGGLRFSLTYLDENGLPLSGLPETYGAYKVRLRCLSEDFCGEKEAEVRVAGSVFGEENYPKIGYIPPEREYDGKPFSAETVSYGMDVRLIYTGTTISGKSYYSEKAPVFAGSYKAVLEVRNGGYEGFIDYKAVDEKTFVIIPRSLVVKPKDFTVEYDKVPEVGITAEGLLESDSLVFIAGYFSLNVILPGNADGPQESQIYLSGELKSNGYKVTYGVGTGCYTKRTQAPPRNMPEISFTKGGIQADLPYGTEWALDVASGFTSSEFIGNVTEGRHTVYIRYAETAKAFASPVVTKEITVKYSLFESPWFYLSVLAVACLCVISCKVITARIERRGNKT